MTTREELAAMSKADLIKHAFEKFGQKFSRRNNKRTLVNSILHLEGEDVEDSGEGGVDDVAEASEPEARAPLPKGHVEVIVTRCPDSTGVDLNVNGRRFHLPPDKPTPVPAWIIPSLRNTAGVDFTVE